MKILYNICIAAGLLLASFSPASATQYITGGVGIFDLGNHDSRISTNFDAEYRGNTFYHGLLPVAGLTVNTDNGMLAYAGFDYEWEFLPNLYLMPGLAVGAWRQGDSADLGGVFEFHESIELDYKFTGDYRAGLQINHTSNAGIYSNNPGVNVLMATVSIPFGN